MLDGINVAHVARPRGWEPPRNRKGIDKATDS